MCLSSKWNDSVIPSFFFLLLFFKGKSLTHFSQGRLFFSQLLFVLMCAGKPQSVESSERVQLSGTYNVRKGKLQLPVNRWTRRQVILCGTCLIVSSIKDSQTGKMHILPLIGGKVRQSRTATTRPDWYRAVFFLFVLSWLFMMFMI